MLNNDGPRFSHDPRGDGSNRIFRSGDEKLNELLTADDLATLLKVSKSWVCEHTRNRGTPRNERLPYIKIGKYVRFDRAAIRAFIQNNSQGHS